MQLESIATGYEAAMSYLDAAESQTKNDLNTASLTLFTLGLFVYV